MDFQETLEKYVLVLRHYWLPLLLGCSGLLFLGYGLISLFSPVSSESERPIVFEQSPKEEQAAEKIIIDIQGAVVKPGVYTLKENSRLQQALIAAGGLAEGADREFIAKQMNLAAKLTDGVKIYIPQKGESVAGSSTSSDPLRQGFAGQGGSINTDGKININTASINQLDTLSGVGMVTAQKIIDNRPYGSVEDLRTKKVVSNSVFEKIKIKISVY